MLTLEAIIRQQIQTSGPMPVGQYMHMCMAHPKYGYYTTRDPLGADGDFTTAPEISQLFGDMIGVWLADVWQQMGCPAPFALIELGPGRGTLMADMLRATRTLSGFHATLNVHLVETSPALRAKQIDTLSASSLTPTHHDDLYTLPQMPSLFVANEFFDALPTNQWVRTEKGWNARKIGLDENDQFTFGVDLTPLPAPKKTPESAPQGTIIEHSPAQDRIMQQLIDHTQRFGGGGLIVDYGATITGHGDTLQAVRKHQAISPFATPGEADLTTHVDFAHLQSLAMDAGIASVEITQQGRFLLQMGLLERAGALGASADAQNQEAISIAVERLAGDAAMGQLFKVLGFCTHQVSLPGFARSAANKPLQTN
jgi:NADH dehydrogenase [ubiquinone] 1 alpha subcomplex assembly factor 7